MIIIVAQKKKKKHLHGLWAKCDDINSALPLALTQQTSFFFYLNIHINNKRKRPGEQKNQTVLGIYFLSVAVCLASALLTH